MDYEIGKVVGIGPVEGIGLFGLFGGTGPVVSLTTELLMSAHNNIIDVLVSGYCYTI